MAWHVSDQVSFHLFGDAHVCPDNTDNLRIDLPLYHEFARGELKPFLIDVSHLWRAELPAHVSCVRGNTDVAHEFFFKKNGLKRCDVLEVSRPQPRVVREDEVIRLEGFFREDF
jgi:hypothetical protein